MKKIIILLTSCLLFQSCATLLRNPKSKSTKTSIHISSSPPKADVYIKNKKIGETPFNYLHKGRKSEKVEIKLDGYLDEQSNISRTINPLWTAISVLGGAFPGNIKTDSIHVNLLSIKGGDSKSKSTELSNTNTNTNNTSNTVNVNQDNPVKQIDKTIISYPALEIITGGYKLNILPKTRARFYLKNGSKFGGLITGVYYDHFKIRGHQDIYFSNIKKVRFFSTRLWYPILTFPTIINPIIWYFSGKVAEYNSDKCKWDIKATRIVEGLREIKYGKVKCD